MPKAVFDNMATYIHIRRNERGMTQMQLAKKLGYTSPQFISNTERRKCSLPLNKFTRLAKVLKVPVGELIEVYKADQEATLNKFFGLQ